MILAYLTTLIFIITCLFLIDHKYKLVFFKNLKLAIAVIVPSLLIFIIWDLLGIKLGIFFEGQTKFMTGIFLLPHFPIEEILFLFALIYMSLLGYKFLELKWPRT